jgi:hypothetical protein
MNCLLDILEEFHLSVRCLRLQLTRLTTQLTRNKIGATRGPIRRAYFEGGGGGWLATTSHYALFEFKFANRLASQTHVKFILFEFKCANRLASQTHVKMLKLNLLPLGATNVYKYVAISAGV